MRIDDLIDVDTRRRKSLPITSYGTADGMKIRECSSIGHPWIASDGTLWFSTLKGVAWIDPAKLKRNMVAPLVAIEQVSVDEKNMPLNEWNRDSALCWQNGLASPAKFTIRWRKDL